jgi:hypothetical protein
MQRGIAATKNKNQLLTADLRGFTLINQTFETRKNPSLRSRAGYGSGGKPLNHEGTRSKRQRTRRKSKVKNFTPSLRSRAGSKVARKSGERRENLTTKEYDVRAKKANTVSAAGQDFHG